MISRKRKQRAVLSCNDCRRRKLSCNRQLPCTRCINSGIAEKCSYRDNEKVNLEEEETYVRDLSRATSNQSTVEATEAGRNQSLPQLAVAYTPADTVAEYNIQLLEHRIATLEAALHALKQEQKDTHSSTTVSNANLTVSSGFFKGRGYQTFYYGPTNPMFVPAHFPHLRPFMQRTYTGSTLSRLRQDMRESEERSHASHATCARVISIPDLRSTLPDRSIVDKIVKTYFDTFECTYRILHAPTFWESYLSYWDLPQPPTSSNSETDVIVLAILACTLCTSTHQTPRYNFNGSTFRGKAMFCLRACEAWLRHQSHKRRSLASVQVRFLRILALSTACSKTKQYYEEVQNLISFLRSIGMHRDPQILGSRCSVFEGEMRRRLWATAMELELQASIDKGIPSVLSSLSYDSSPPRNINDSDLFPSMKHLPLSHPPSTYTSTSFLHHASTSLPLRVRLCTHINNVDTQHPSAAQKQKDEYELQKAISLLPQWTEPHALHASTLLDLQLRQWLMHLHKAEVLRLATAADSSLHRQHPSTRYALIATLEAASSCITSHARLINSNTFALCLLRSDYLTAAFLICHISYHACVSGDTMISRLAHSLFASSTEAALKLVEERCMRPGRGNHKYWYLSAACSLAGMQWERDDEGRRAEERLACERVCKVLYKELAAREDNEESGEEKAVIMGGKGVSEVCVCVCVSCLVLLFVFAGLPDRRYENDHLITLTRSRSSSSSPQTPPLLPPPPPSPTWILPPLRNTTTTTTNPWMPCQASHLISYQQRLPPFNNTAPPRKRG